MVKILLLHDHLVIILLGLSFPGPDVSQTPLVVTPARQITLHTFVNLSHYHNRPFLIFRYLTLINNITTYHEG